MERNESFLFIDGLNLCFKARLNHKQIENNIKKAMKVFRKFMKDKVPNRILVYGVLPHNNDLETSYNELLKAIELKK